jgi:hypothetical protein
MTSDKILHDCVTVFHRLFAELNRGIQTLNGPSLQGEENHYQLHWGKTPQYKTSHLQAQSRKTTQLTFLSRQAPNQVQHEGQEKIFMKLPESSCKPTGRKLLPMQLGTEM